MRYYFVAIKGALISLLALCAAFLVFWTGTAIIDHLFNKGWGYPPFGWLWGILCMLFLGVFGWLSMGVLRVVERVTQSRGGR
jgi:hypothetical protein